jgi:hypothetical protein
LESWKGPLPDEHSLAQKNCSWRSRKSLGRLNGMNLNQFLTLGNEDWSSASRHKVSMSAEVNRKTTAEILCLIPNVGCQRLTGQPMIPEGVVSARTKKHRRMKCDWLVCNSQGKNVLRRNSNFLIRIIVKWQLTKPLT